MKSIAQEAGALGFSISGAGPSMFALCDSSLTAMRIVEEAQALYSRHKIEVNAFTSLINHEGAVRY